MTYPVPQGTILGRLKMLEVYDVYDGPRLFSLASATGATFLAFWINEGTDADEWLYIGISALRLDQVVEGIVSLRKAFVDAEDGVLFRVLTRFEGTSDIATPTTPSEIDEQLLPLEHDRLQGQRLRVFQEETSTQEIPQDLLLGRILQKLKLKHRRSRPIAFDAVTAVLSKWQTFFESALGNTGQLIPVLGTPGSFNLTLTLPKDRASSQAFDIISDFVANMSGDSIDLDSKNAKVDLREFEALVAVLREHELILTIEQEGASASTVLDPRTDSPIVRFANEAPLHTTLASDEIPQADDLGRILRLLELMRTRSNVTADKLEVVDRQVNYYKQACRILRLLDEDNQLTSVGQRTITLPNKRAKFEALAIQFETSTCGWRWIYWSKGTRLLDVKPQSAEKFLIESAPVLSEATTRRRARTLETWCRTLQEAILPFGSFLLTKAEELASQGFLPTAAVVAGLALEDHLYKLAICHSLLSPTTDAGQFLPGFLNNELHAAGIYSLDEHSMISSWQRTRNAAAHGQLDPIHTTPEIRRMISEVKGFIEKHPS